MRSTLLAAAFAMWTVAASAQTRPPEACERLQSLPLPHGTVSAASMFAVTSYDLPGSSPEAPASIALPASCRIVATIRPTPGSDIQIEVWMPDAQWNGKLLGTGNVNWCGAVNPLAIALGLREHYATAGTDRGTRICATDDQAREYMRLAEDPERLVDFGHRAVHEMTVSAKLLVAAFYGTAPTRSYFVGGSSGGGQALMEAQRYPEDYDGIVAGAPTHDYTHFIAAGVWNNAQVAGVLPRPKRLLLNDAVLEACDSPEQIGLLEDPRQCRFDPESLLCPGEDTPECLTRAQVDAARRIYAGPTNPRTGEVIYPGLERGSERYWPGNNWQVYFQYLVHKDSTWTFQRFDLDSDVVLGDQVGEVALNAVDPDLRPFVTRGGKLILHHGWADAVLAPQRTIGYYESVVAMIGDRSDDSIRLFMIPRVSHGSGPGTDQYNMLPALERWVEEGVAPDRVLAQHVTGNRITMERPLCPYPQLARWKGSGSKNDAGNFECVFPAATSTR